MRNLPTLRHDVGVSYFTAVLARAGHGWRGLDVEVDAGDTLDGLADLLRSSAPAAAPVLAVLEREDAWFALVRVDGEDDVRVFVSDMGAASRSTFADLLAPAADVEVAVDDDDAAPSPPVPDPDDEVEVEDVDVDDDGETEVPDDPAPWAGDPDLLDDLGVDGRRLAELATEKGDDPAAVLAEVGEECGFAEHLEALR